MSEFIYNETSREHTLDGKPIPSVSQVIDPLCNFEGIPKEVLVRKTELGIQFHEAIRLHLCDDLDFDSIDPDLVKPMRVFQVWWNNFSPFGRGEEDIEKPIYHKTLKYCGKPDLVTATKLYDWKLRLYNPITDTLKLVAYNHMLLSSRKVNESRRDCWTVCFDLDGRVKTHRSQNPKAWGVFRKMLERYNSEQKFNSLMEDWRGVN